MYLVLGCSHPSQDPHSHGPASLAGALYSVFSAPLLQGATLCTPGWMQEVLLPLPLLEGHVTSDMVASGLAVEAAREEIRESMNCRSIKGQGVGTRT